MYTVIRKDQNMKQIDVECDDHVATHYGMHIRVYVRIVIPVFWANKCTKFALNTYRFVSQAT